jgi:hypothetical protein
MNLADMLDRELERGARAERAPVAVRELLGMAAEVVDALAAVRLSSVERQHIYARSLAMLEAAVHEQRRGWQRALRLERPAPAIVGGAALTIGAAAIGWAVLHGRRGPARSVAA